MKFQINGGGWLVDQTLIPHGAIIAADGKENYELTPEERLAKDHIPPLSVTALDYDAALTLARAYPAHQHLLRRHLSPFDAEMFQRLLMDETVLDRLWPKG